LKVKNTFYSRASYLLEADQGACAIVLNIGQNKTVYDIKLKYGGNN
jgi:hypothetical protein